MEINKLASACVDSKHVSTGSSVQHLLMLKKIPEKATEDQWHANISCNISC